MYGRNCIHVPALNPPSSPLQGVEALFAPTWDLGLASILDARVASKKNLETHTPFLTSVFLILLFSYYVCSSAPLQLLADKHAAAVADLEASFEEQKTALRKEAAGLATEAVRAAEEKMSHANKAK